MERKTLRHHFVYRHDVIMGMKRIKPLLFQDPRPAEWRVLAEGPEITTFALMMTHYRDEKGWEKKWVSDFKKISDRKALDMLRKMLFHARLPWPTEIIFDRVNDAIRLGDRRRPARRTILAAARWRDDLDYVWRLNPEIVPFPGERKNPSSPDPGADCTILDWPSS